MTTGERVVLVTGGGRGLGRAMVLGLLADGATVIAVDRDAEVLEPLAAAAATERLDCRATDLAQDGAAESLIDAALERHGRIDALINCAGIGQETISADFVTNPIPPWTVTLRQWRSIFAVNAEAVFRLCNAVLPGMLARRDGRIVNVTTSLETMILRGMSPYGPSKAAVEAYSAILAKELDGSGVTVNVLVPGGPADTRMMAGVPASRLVPPEAMVAPVCYLVSAEGGQVNGRRFRASAWDPAMQLDEAMAAAGAPLAWAGIAGGAADRTWQNSGRQG